MIERRRHTVSCVKEAGSTMATITHRSPGEKDQQLLPGIPDEITLDLIASKLSWKFLHILSSVSRSWQEAIRSKEVYKARVRTNSTETLLALHDQRGRVALCSPRDNRCYQLPPMPCHGGPPLLDSCGYIALDGKLYVLGGVFYKSDPRMFNALAEVYVLDLARGSHEWARCADMLQARSDFVCGVLDGKIFVFGGTTNINSAPLKLGYALLGAEVYDPQKNSWSPIIPMSHVRDDNQVATIGNELFLYDGYQYELDPEESRDQLSKTHDFKNLQHKTTMTPGVYNPVRNEWRLDERLNREGIPELSVLFVAKENFYLLSESRIDVYDVEQKSWIKRYTNSFVAVRPNGYTRMRPRAVLAIKDELFCDAFWYNDDDEIDDIVEESYRSKGLNDEKTLEMVWQKADCLFAYSHCSVEL